MNCEKCGKVHNGTYGSGRFCSKECARSFSTSNKKKETKILKCICCGKEVKVGKRASKVRCGDCVTKRHVKKCPTCGKKFNTTKIKQIYCSCKCSFNSEKYKHKMREHANRRQLGGHTSKKSIYYDRGGDKVYLQSSYEYNVAVDLDKHGIKWSRPKFLYWTDECGNRHRYYPDFYLPEYNVYLDPKNDYLIKKDKYKIECVSKQNNVKVIMLDSNQLNWNSIKSIIGE